MSENSSGKVHWYQVTWLATAISGELSINSSLIGWNLLSTNYQI